jgi:4-hydroxy-3-polyprenylbenzoate decarboxylase
MSTAHVDRPRRFIVGLTGASGALYAERLLAALATTAHQVEIVPSKVGGEIFRQERGRSLDAYIDELVAGGARMRAWNPADFYAPFASGTQRYDGMAIVPCSAGAMGRIAFGTSPDLVSRAADVCLKEGRPLVLLVREAPFSEIHLRNMLRLRRAGAVIMPASPAFYSHPKDLTEMADSLVQRVLDHLEIDVPVFRRWRQRAGEMQPRGPRPVRARPVRARDDNAPPASGTDDPRP